MRTQCNQQSFGLHALRPAATRFCGTAWCAIVVRPNGAATCQPRASPWGPEHDKVAALKGRNRQILESPSSFRLMNGTLGIDRLYRPFRAYWSYALPTQGVALGCHVVAPLGRRVTTRVTQIEASPPGEKCGLIPCPMLVAGKLLLAHSTPQITRVGAPGDGFLFVAGD